MQANLFTFKKYNFDEATGELRLCYGFDTGDEFEEVITFPESSHSLARNELQILDQAFQLIFLLAGVSYFKAFAPSKMKCDAFAIDKETATFIETTYRHGLGEFAHKNNIDLNFEIEAYDIPTLSEATLDLSDKLLVPVGGGKDSIVTIEALKQADEDITLFALGGPNGPAEPIIDTIDKSGLPVLYVERVLSPNLIKLNEESALNGHVPITAILSAIALACAVMHGMKSVVLSNEHSASAPNIKIGDHEVNHQYSKSLAFENAFADYIHAHISPDLGYFSFLRPFTETAIAKRFAALDNYHDIFRSCNTAFRQDEEKRGTDWCCDCPKCRFVFLALAPFMAKDKLLRIFGSNLLDDEAQLEGYKELCGLGQHKPFECVGEVEESALLLGQLSQMDEWRRDLVVASIGDPFYNEAKFNELFTLRQDHNLSDDYVRILNEDS